MIKWTIDQFISLVIIIGLIACAPLEITVPRLCPGCEMFSDAATADAIALNETGVGTK